MTSIDEVSAYPSEPERVRFVTCIPPCEGTVEQHPDAAGAWRPDPPICAACRERLAEQEREWYAHCGRAREAA